MRARVLIPVVLFANLLPVGLAHISEAAQEPQAPRTLADYDGDGYGDLAIAVSQEDSTAGADTGAVEVLYGTATGLSATGRPDQFWTQDSAGIDGTAEASDYFGASLATADFNGDGYSDLAIGALGEAVGAVGNAGAVNVIYGSPSGLSPTFVADQLWTQDTQGVQDTAETDDTFGSALATGDFDGDGYPDLAIGSTYESVGSTSSAGSVNVIYGSPSGLNVLGTGVADQFWTQNSPDVNDSAEPFDYFGSALAAGDLDADGIDDLAIGAVGENVSGQTDAGAVEILYGSDTGLNPSGRADQFWTQDSTDVEGAAEESDQFGWTLAIGEFGRDAAADLAIGVVGEDLDAIESCGAVNVLYGVAGTGVTSTADQLWLEGDLDLIGGPEPVDFFGWALATGDFGRGAYDDLAIGTPGQTLGAADTAGAVHVIYGTAYGLLATTPADQYWTQNSANVEDTAEDFDHFGDGLAASNLGGSPQADLVIGVSFENVGAGSWAGAVNVIYGTANGLSATVTPDQFWSQDSPDVNDRAESNDHFGAALAASAPAEFSRESTEPSR